MFSKTASNLVHDCSTELKLAQTTPQEPLNDLFASENKADEKNHKTGQQCTSEIDKQVKKTVSRTCEICNTPTEVINFPKCSDFRFVNQFPYFFTVAVNLLSLPRNKSGQCRQVFWAQQKSSDGWTPFYSEGAACTQLQ